jgi:hypothetical protein
VLVTPPPKSHLTDVTVEKLGSNVKCTDNESHPFVTFAFITTGCALTTRFKKRLIPIIRQDGFFIQLIIPSNIKL